MVKSSKAWFTPVRGSYLPASWQGWLTYVPYIAYLAFALVFGMINTASWAEAILFVVPNWVTATIVMTWIAKRYS